MENEVMATRQTSKQAKAKTEVTVDTGVINKPMRNGERKAERRNPRHGHALQRRGSIKQEQRQQRLTVR